MLRLVYWTMTPSAPIDLLLVGAGHAHLHLLRHAQDLVKAGYAVHLLAPAQFRYSGVASATATGALPTSEGVVNVAALAAKGPVQHRVGTLTELDLEGRQARCDDGRWLDYDVISFNIGSAAATHDMVVGDGVLTVKPLEALAGLDARITAAVDALADSQRSARVTIVGGGSSSLELAGNVACRDGVVVNVVEESTTISPLLSARARSAVLKLLTARGVRVHTDLAVTSVDTDRVVLSDGRVMAHDVVILATGLVASPLIQTLGLAFEGRPGAGIPIRASLQHPDHEEVYAAGDCSHFLPRPLLRIGVYGVRQGPVLLAALVARATGGEAPQFHPQREVLQILDLGGGYGLATRGRWWWMGRGPLRLKRLVDRRWLAKYV
ncbi:MAG: FAD-dependent oxidoreductase [Ornithinimicrobium sp.]